MSDNGPEIVGVDLTLWYESLRIKKMESPVYHPRAYGLAERAVHTTKRALQAWNPNIILSFGASNMTHRKTSKMRGKFSVELLLGIVRLPAIADFDVCELILLMANEKTKTVPSIFIIRKGLNIFHTARKLNAHYPSERKAICNTRRDKIKMEPPEEKTITQSEPRV